jgi:hypothetical protein
VHIAVTGMHMQSGPHTAFQNPLMGGVQGLSQRGKSGAIEQTVQGLAHIGFPAGPQTVLCKSGKKWSNADSAMQTSVFSLH